MKVDRTPQLQGDTTYGQTNNWILILSATTNHDCIPQYIFSLSNKRPSANLPFHEDYPMNDTHWNYYETFEFDFIDLD